MTTTRWERVTRGKDGKLDKNYSGAFGFHAQDLLIESLHQAIDDHVEAQGMDGFSDALYTWWRLVDKFEKLSDELIHNNDHL